MAKILYGLMGNTNGHIMRSLAIARRMPEHEFYFVGGHRVPEALRDSYPVLEVPVLRTMHRKQHVNVPKTFWQIVSRVMDVPRVTGQISKLIESWQPDMAICDREFFLPLACRRAGLRCLSINHSRLLLACRYHVPREQWVSWGLAMLNDSLLFNFTQRHLIVSFFHPPLKCSKTDELMPPVLRPEVSRIRSVCGEHVLVYQTTPTFSALVGTLRKLSRPVIIYGYQNSEETVGNITFRSYHPEKILNDLASCSYAVVNGGHNLISEALFYGKPVLCFPVATLFEQFINSWHVRELGYGDFSTSLDPDLELFKAFERNLESYRMNLKGKHFDGTASVVRRVQEILAETGR